MLLKITYPYKDSLATLQFKSIYIQTDDHELVKEIKATKNPIDIGVILSENEKNIKIIQSTQETPDEEIVINELVTNPELRQKFNYL